MDIRKMINDAQATKELLIGDELTEEEFENALAFLESMLAK